MGAKLFFYYSAMNAGKSTTMLQANHNYNEKGIQTMLFIPELIGTGQVNSRIGLSAPAISFNASFNFFEFVSTHQRRVTAADVEDSSMQPCGCLLLDEAQFLSREQVHQLVQVVDELQIPVLCYGLRSDFTGEPFEGSKYLLCLADSLSEIKTICHCGRKATMNQRITADGKAVATGAQVEVSVCDTVRYVGRCRKHFYESIREAEAKHVEAEGSPCRLARQEADTENQPVRTPEKVLRKAEDKQLAGLQAIPGDEEPAGSPEKTHPLSRSGCPLQAH